MANALTVTLHAAGAESASGSGSAVSIGELRSCLKLRLRLDSISGTGAKLTVTVETASTSTGPWQPVDSFVTLSVAKTVDRVFADCLPYVRVSWQLTGSTSSATFAVTGAAHVLYARLADFGTHSIPKEALGSVPRDEQAAICLAATDEADGYLAAGKKLPLTAWGDDLTAHVANIVAYRVMKRRGFQPEGDDTLIVKDRDDAIAWLKGVGAGRIEPPGMVDSTPETYDAGLYVVSDGERDPGGLYWP